jgi:hypothetical protein
MSSRTVDTTVMHALHDAFRRDLELLTRAAAGLAEDPGAQERLRLGWSIRADQLHHHHRVEHEQLWPLVRRSWRRSPDALAVLDAMEDEHELVDPALAAVGGALDARVFPAQALDRLRTIVSQHLDHEEAEAMPLIQAAVTPRDWDSFSAKQARSLGIKGVADCFRGCSGALTTSAPNEYWASSPHRCAGPTAVGGSHGGLRETTSSPARTDRRE